MKTTEYFAKVNRVKKSHALSWFPKLFNASEQERNDYNISPFVILWEKIHEDLSFEDLSKFKK